MSAVVSVMVRKINLHCLLAFHVHVTISLTDDITCAPAPRQTLALSIMCPSLV